MFSKYQPLTRVDFGKGIYFLIDFSINVREKDGVKNIFA
jgi:hypothetical protein